MLESQNDRVRTRMNRMRGKQGGVRDRTNEGERGTTRVRETTNERYSIPLYRVRETASERGNENE